MKKVKIILALFVLMGFFTLFLVGCGDDTLKQIQNDYGVIVEGGGFQEGSVVVTKEIGATDTEGFLVVELIKDVDYDQFSPIYIYEIYVLYESKKVQPDGTVKVTLPIKQNITDFIIIHLKSDNSNEILYPTIEDGKAIFEVSSFSYFIVASKNAATGCSHEYGEWHVSKEATCTSKGLKIKNCLKCKKELTEEIPALEHDLVQHEAKAATCTEPGHAAYKTCSRCDYTTYQEIPALEHDLVQHEAKDATCTEAGHNAYEECSNCDYTTYQEIPALEHDLVHHEAQDATCTEAGHNAYEECSNCDYTTYEEIPALEHDYSEWEISKKPTCSEEGVGSSKCINCGNTIESTIDKIDHTFGEWTITSESTCSKHGTQQRQCLICEHIDTQDAPLANHEYGEWVVIKEPTVEEEGIERSTCINCDAYKDSALDKLVGITIVVSGGTVNKKGENLNQSTITVGYGEVVEIVANTYENLTFYQWFSDSSEVIPISSFELYATRNAYFYICFEEGLDYSDWTEEQELTCTEDGIYSRTDATTGLKQYMVKHCRGHYLDYYNSIVLEEATCTEGGMSCYKCSNCDYQECEETSPKGHEFNDYVIIEEAYGSKVGLRQAKCEHCDATDTKEYIKALYPSGNIKVEFEWNNLSYVSSADRDEVHWMMDENKYCFYIVRDSSGHSSGNYMHFYFYYEDNGPNSPVYIRKMVGSLSTPQRDYYGSYKWGIVGYVDSYEEFIEYIDDENKGADNGLNNTSLYHMYEMWERIFNENGCIPSSYYCSGVTEYLGYTCRVYENDGFAYYVNEDNCCLYYSGKGTNRYHAFVTSITELSEMPYGPFDIESVNHIMIDIENGTDYSFNDQYYFQVEALYNEVEIYESNYISNRQEVIGYQVKNHDGEWVPIVELSNTGKRWYIDSDTNNNYRYIINTYLDGIYPEVLEIKPILVDAELPIHVTVDQGNIYADSKNYGSDNYFLANEEITVYPEFNELLYKVASWDVTVNGVTTNYTEEYMYSITYTLPESGEVSFKLNLVERGTIPVTFNIIGNGTLSVESGNYVEGTSLEVFANPDKGAQFIGWFVVGLFYMPEGDIEGGSMPSFDSSYYEYGEYFNSNPRIIFDIYDPYDTVVITAVFEDLDITRDYIDVIATDGFLSLYNRDPLHVSALRLADSNSLDIHGPDDVDNISGWIITEQRDPVSDVEISGQWGYHYFEVDSTVKPVYSTSE